MVAVYCVFAVRLVAGVNVAVWPPTLTEPMTAAPPAVGCSVKLPLFSVVFVITTEKVAATEEFSAIPVAPLIGEVAVTVGAVACATSSVTEMSPGDSPPQPNKDRLANRAA